MDAGRFDSLTRSLATPKSRRGFLGTLAAVGAGLLGAKGGGAQVTQAQCGNVSCKNNPGRCNQGCVCCVYGNGNTRCTPPGNCTGTPTCPPGTVVDPVRGCVAPSTTTSAPSTTQAPATTTTAAPATTLPPATTTTSTTAAPTTAAPTTAAPTTTTAAPTTAAPTTTTAAPTTAAPTTPAPTTTTTTTTVAPTTTTTTTTTTTSTTTTAPPCPSGATPCGDACVYMASDSSNCGACGNVCSSDGGVICLNGVCCQSGDGGLAVCSANTPCCNPVAQSCQSDRCCRTAGQSCTFQAQCCAGLACNGGTCGAPTTTAAPTTTTTTTTAVPCVGCLPEHDVCLANGSCAETCAGFGDCRSGCSCGESVEGTRECIASVDSCDQMPLACDGTAGCPQGHHCQLTSCGPRGALDPPVRRCVPLCAPTTTTTEPPPLCPEGYHYVYGIDKCCSGCTPGQCGVQVDNCGFTNYCGDCGGCEGQPDGAQCGNRGRCDDGRCFKTPAPDCTACGGANYTAPNSNGTTFCVQGFGTIFRDCEADECSETADCDEGRACMTLNCGDGPTNRCVPACPA